MKITTSMTHMLLTFFLLISSCSSSPTKDINAKMDSTFDRNKVLIVYLSRTNNTKAMAEIIHNNVGGTLVALELEKPYPENYQATVQQVVKENETGYLPPLKTKIDSIEKYDVVFLGFPTWDMKMPPPMKTFLHQHNLSGKTVIPFNTNGGYGVGSGFQTVKDLCPGSIILEGFAIQGGLERDGEYLVIKGKKAERAQTEVKKWLRRIKITE
jgi:flavodoxin